MIAPSTEAGVIPSSAPASSVTAEEIIPDQQQQHNHNQTDKAVRQKEHKQHACRNADCHKTNQFLHNTIPAYALSILYEHKQQIVHPL